MAFCRLGLCHRHRPATLQVLLPFKFNHYSSLKEEHDPLMRVGPQPGRHTTSLQRQRQRQLLQSHEELEKLYPIKPDTRVTLQSYLDNLPRYNPPSPRASLESHLETPHQKEKRLALLQDERLAKLSLKTRIPLINLEDPTLKFKSPLMEFFENGELIPEQLQKSKMNPIGM